MNRMGKMITGGVIAAAALVAVFDTVDNNSDNKKLKELKTELKNSGIDQKGYDAVIAGTKGKTPLVSAVGIQRAIDSVTYSPARVQFEAGQLIQKAAKAAR